jgi:uncharacterized protein
MTKFLGFALALVLATTSAADSMKGPWEAASSRRAAKETRPEVIAAGAMLRAFQRVISPVDGPRCRLVPTCSEFARQAVKRYGLPIGIMLTASRLMRDNASVERYYRRALIGGRIVLYDPPEDHWPLWGHKR